MATDNNAGNAMYDNLVEQLQNLRRSQRHIYCAVFVLFAIVAFMSAQSKPAARSVGTIKADRIILQHDKSKATLTPSMLTFTRDLDGSFRAYGEYGDQTAFVGIEKVNKGRTRQRKLGRWARLAVDSIMIVNENRKERQQGVLTSNGLRLMLKPDKEAVTHTLIELGRFEDKSRAEARFYNLTGSNVRIVPRRN